MIRRPIKPSVAAMLLLCLGGTVTPGQNPNGTMTGKVTDSSGAAVVNAEVRVTNAQTAATLRSGRTSERGDYVAPLLPAGTYNVSAEQKGFKKTNAENVVVSLGQTRQVDLVMTVGEVTESVDVSAEAAAIAVDRNTSSVSTLINPSQVRDLPLPNRDPMNLMVLVPGVSNGGSGTAVNSWQMSVNGSRTLNTEVLLDGSSVIENVTGQISQLPSPDALQEFRVMTSAYTAESGRTSGGTISINMRTGGNDFHGGLYELFRNEKLNANNFFNNLRGIRRPPDRYNQFGGTLGGPVWIPKLYNGRNRTFFFFNLDQTVQRSPSIPTQTVPTADFKAGNFSRSLLVVNDPRSNVPFAGNLIPGDRVDPVAAKVMSLLPTPNASGTADPQNSRSINNWIYPQTLVATAPRYTGRLDHILNDKLRLFGSINAWSTNSPTAQSLNSILNANATGWRNGYEASVGLTDLITPTLIADFRFGFNRWIEQAQFPSLGVDPRQALGIGTAPAPLPPNLSIAGWMGIGPVAGGLKNAYSNTFNFQGTVTKVLAAHTWKAGFGIRRDQFNSFTPPSYYMGQYVFNGSITNRGNVGGNAINSLADFLLGAVTSAQYEIPQPLTGRRNANYSAFVQDDWKITDRLTLNAGVRWDYETPMSIANNIYSRFDPVSGELLVAGKNASNTLNIATPQLNFGPRIGLAYAIRPRTVIRTAAGIFYSQLMSNLGASVNYPGYDVTQSFPQPGPGLAQPFTLAQGMPLIGVQNLNDPTSVLRTATLASPANAGVSFSQVNPLPSVMQWNFGIQQEFMRQSVLEVNYIGNAAKHLPLFLSGNNIPFDRGVELARTGVATTTQASRPFPLISGITGLYDAGHSSYHALQVSARKQFSSSFGYQAAYTWSKSIDDGSGIFPFSQPNGISPGQFPVYFRQLDRSASAFDVTHRFSFGGQFRTRGPWWLRNFQIAPIFVAQTGLPLTITQSNFYPGVSQQRPMLTGSGDVRLAATYPNGQGVQYLSLATAQGFPLSPSGPVFTGQGTTRQQLVSGDIGSLGRYTVRAPGSINLNVSVSRRFQVAERLSMQLRLDAFNVLNQVNFGSPATTLSVATQGNTAIFNSPGFGLITSAASGRFLQIVTRLDF